MTEFQQPPVIRLKAPTSQSLVVPVMTGPPGKDGLPGKDGASFDGTAWFYGEGVPFGVVGSKPGDCYMDVTTGTIYKLGD